MSVEVTEVNGIEVDDVNLPETGEDEVLEKFAADAAGADE